METEFTPLLSLAGGMLIGAAAVLFMAGVGRIAGISGIISRLLPPRAERGSFATGLALLVGLLLAAPVYTLFGELPAQSVSSNAPLLIIAGLLVGIGTSVGSGCTSGHGVCGISRLSARSLVATLTFMITAVITVYILRHIVN
ncbi:hypothetical protein AB833_17980 [Chromatiales bacterium (ex Bugula neritina AB1)]|nr:hypothetical protein AB833_17980 [Chromatiales bacterium (ex Bugula neritina AB1)]